MTPLAAEDDARAQELAARLKTVEQRICDACDAAGRDRGEVTLVAITKYFPADDVARLVRLGVTDIGENKHQEASAKLAELDAEVRGSVRAHFVGQLQSNKAPAVTAYADVVQSLDRPKIAAALQRGAERYERGLDVTLQVDLGGDDAGRGGVLPKGVAELADAVADCPSLDLRGLMAVAPLASDPRPAFEQLRELSDALRADHPEATWISAGMSGDLEAAVTAGATHLRVGSAILGSRPPLR